MIHVNGISQTPKDISRDDLRQIRRKNAYTRETIRSRGLERSAKLMESFANYDWLNVYSDMLDRFRNPDMAAFSISSVGDRRWGMNYPVFRNEVDLARLRMPSRILCATNNYAIGLLSGLTSYVIGAGFDYRAASMPGMEGECPKELIKACQLIIEDFAKLNDWHGGEQPGMEAELFWRSCEDGEFFLRCFPQEDGKTKVRTVEPEQVTMPGGAVMWNGARVFIPANEGMFGVVTPSEDAQDVRGYYVFYGTDVAGGSVIPHDEMVHLRRNVHRSIKRGMPDFSFDSHTKLVLASKLAHSLGTCGAIQAAIPWIEQFEVANKATVLGLIDGLDAGDLNGDYTQPNLDTGKTDTFSKIEPGTIPHIAKGHEYVPSPSAGNAQQHLAILQMLAQSGGNRWNAPAWLATADNTSANYATALTEESPFIKTVTRNQTAYKGAFVKSFWFALEHFVKTRGGLRVVARVGDVLREMFFTWHDIKRMIDIQVEAHNPEVRNKLDDAQRQTIQIQAGTLSPQTAMAEDGRDVDREQTNILEWRETMGTQMGPTLPPAGGIPSFGEPPAVPAPVPTAAIESLMAEMANRFHGELVSLRESFINAMVTVRDELAAVRLRESTPPAAPVVTEPAEQPPINLTLNITNPAIENNVTIPEQPVQPAAVVNVSPPDVLVNLSPNIAVTPPDVVVNVNPAITVEQPLREPKTITVKHSDGTTSTITEGDKPGTKPIR